MDEDEENPFGEIISKYADEDGVHDALLAKVKDIGLESAKVSLVTVGILKKYSTRYSSSFEKGQKGERLIDLNGLRQLLSKADDVIGRKNDWFYSFEFDKQKYFVAQNNTPRMYTIMLPEEY